MMTNDSIRSVLAGLCAAAIVGCGDPASGETGAGTTEAATTQTPTTDDPATTAPTGADTGPETTSNGESSGGTTGSVTTTSESSSSSDDAPPVIFDVGTGDESGGGTGREMCMGGVSVLPATIRDFASSHVDFEVFWGSVQTTGLVLPTLDVDGTPQHNPVPPFSPPGSSPVQITSAQSFSNWYHDVDGINLAVEIEIELTETEVGSGILVYDDPTFFPIDDAGWNGAPGPNNETFPDTLGEPHNFHFTTEIHTSFVYEQGQVYGFIGDDDLWVFIDGALVIDLGGLHGEVEGTVDLDTLGLTEGVVYTMDIFHAERRHDGSHFRIETSIDCFLPPAG